MVNNLIVQALKGGNITSYGEGSQTRSFCYVDDLIEGIIRLMDLPEGEDGQPGFPGPMNIGNPNEFTIRELAEKVIEILDLSPSSFTCRCPPMIRCRGSRIFRWLGG